MTDTDVEYLKEKGDIWTCMPCLSNTRQTRSNSLSSAIHYSDPKSDVAGSSLSSEGKILAMLQHITEEIKVVKENQLVSSKQVADCMSQLKLHSQLIASNESMIRVCEGQVGELIESQNDLQQRVDDIAAKVETVTSLNINQPTTISPLPDVNAGEIIERALRASNILIYNLPESSERDQVHDSEEACKILNAVDPTSATQIMSCRRLGKVLPVGSVSDGSKPRPLKVVLTGADVARTVMRKKKVLSATDYKNISISDDKTPAQIRELKMLREELKRRTASGERNLTIKYDRGVPTIVEQQPKN